MLLSGLGLATEIGIATAAGRERNIIFSTCVSSWQVMPGERFRWEKHNHQSQDPITAMRHRFSLRVPRTASVYDSQDKAFPLKKESSSASSHTDSRVAGSIVPKIVL